MGGLMVLIYIPCKKLALSENAGKRLTNGKRLGKAAAALDKCTTNTNCGRPVHGADEYGSDRIGWRYGGQWVEAPIPASDSYSHLAADELWPGSFRVCVLLAFRFCSQKSVSIDTGLQSRGFENIN